MQLEAYYSADEARFELAVGFPTTVFKTVSLDRSDTHPFAHESNQIAAFNAQVVSISSRIERNTQHPDSKSLSTKK